MAELVAMPKLGFDMAEGTLVRWVIAEGGEVAKGAVLAEIETDKATVEVESSAAGILYRRLVEEGAVVPVGTAIAVIAAPGEEVKDLPESGAVTEKVEKPPAKAAKQKAEPSPAKESTAGEKTEEKTLKPTAAVKPVETAAPADEMLRVSPLARRMALENKINLQQVVGTGPAGRITRKDVEKALQTGTAAAVPAEAGLTDAAAPTGKLQVPVPAVSWTPGTPVPADEHVPVEKLRAIIGKRMIESKQQVPHFYVTSAYNMAPLLDLRKQVNVNLPEDARLSVNDFIIKAVALTLRQFPNLNASLTEKEIIRHGHINIGVAVALDSGLMTVVCQDADQKPLRLIGQEVREMATRARSGKVRPDDIEGSTFSISNLGMYDVEHFVAIINPPEAAILAVGSAQSVPVVVDGEVKVGMQMKATLSADHRVTDGAEGAKFMQALAEFIENPLRLLL
ncbi:MAG TPA: dihydrolipoamide acetyltransferase family protein [Bellilinea sp.]|nr:dihydrolipoamide acetyltransferase family protein [Bellilinea sp.]